VGVSYGLSDVGGDCFFTYTNRYASIKKAARNFSPRSPWGC
jgi:hypothetical protein